MLMMGIGNSYANPGQRQELREDARVIQFQQILEHREQGRGERQVQKADRPRPGESGSSEGGGQNAQENAAPDEARKPGRMTPEERRALRRQINEAGRDIYAPPR